MPRSALEEPGAWRGLSHRKSSLSSTRLHICIIGTLSELSTEKIVKSLQNIPQEREFAFLPVSACVCTADLI